MNEPTQLSHRSSPCELNNSVSVQSPISLNGSPEPIQGSQPDSPFIKTNARSNQKLKDDNLLASPSGMSPSNSKSSMDDIPGNFYELDQELKALNNQWQQIFNDLQKFEKSYSDRLDALIQKAENLEQNRTTKKEILAQKLKSLSQSFQI